MKNLRIGTKIWILVVTIALFAAIAIIGGKTAISKVEEESLVQIEKVMSSGYRVELKALVDSAALSMAAEIEGISDPQEVIERLRKMNNPIRFFDNKSGYFFIYDLNGVNISLPPKQSLHGKNLIDLKDQNGLYLVKELIQAARNGGGFVEYVWPKPPSDDLKQKLSYARMIPGTNFWIGTGIYTDDIDAQKTSFATALDKQVGPVLWWSTALLALFFLCLVLPMALMLIRQIVRPVKQLRAAAHELEQGNLSVQIDWQSGDEIGELSASLAAMAKNLCHYAEQATQIANGNLMVNVRVQSANDTFGQALQQMVSNLQTTIGNIQNSAEQISSGSNQVSDSSQSLSQGATESAASLEEISSSMTVIGEQTKQSAENAHQADLLASEAVNSATTGSKHMAEMISAMAEINESGENIRKIIKVIDEIAFQTNLLALNAAVEAARAGQHGKGFAVVAEEVRNLAGRSAKAASETAQLIQGSVEKAANGTQIAERTSEALDAIVREINKVNELIVDISSSSNEQAQGIAQINIGLQQIDQVIQQNTATAEESAATSEELSSQAAILKQQLGRFQLAAAGSFAPAPQIASAPPGAARSAQNSNSGWGAVAAQAPQQSGSEFVIRWDDRLNTGIQIVDKQHRKLVELINQLFQCMKDGGDRMLLGSIIDELVDYTVTHFRTEEEMMQRTGYPGLEQHKIVHQTFVTTVGEALTKLKNGERVAPADMYKFLKGWLIDHIEKQDRDGYAPHVKKRS